MIDMQSLQTFHSEVKFIQYRNQKFYTKFDTVFIQTLTIVSIKNKKSF